MPDRNLKAVCSGFYDLQKMRIQSGNRIVMNFKKKLGQDPGEREETLSADSLRILKLMRESYDSITSAVASQMAVDMPQKRSKRILPSPANFVGTGVISDYAELVLVAMYIALLEDEENYTAHVRDLLKSRPFWNHWLGNIKGVGELMGMVILSTIDIEKARHPSSLWKYAGLDVAPDGKGRSRRAGHMVDVEYKSKSGEIKTRKSLGCNPFLKSKLVKVLGTSFLRSGENKYSRIYYDYKHRMESHPVHGKSQEEKPGHRHNMAMRYMVKIFLIDLYAAWREFEGLPVSKPYHEAKLGLKHEPNGPSKPENFSEPAETRKPSGSSEPEEPPSGMAAKGGE